MNWADEVERDESGASGGFSSLPRGELPGPSEEFDKEKGIKTVTDYKYNDDDRLVKVVSVYRVEHRKVSKSIALRKTWKKYGLAEDDPPGPNTNNTFISDEVFIQFTHNKDEAEPEEEMVKAKPVAKSVMCRTCKGNHWTIKCPYKDQLQPLQDSLKATDEAKKEESPAAGAATKGKYVPPNMRDGSRSQGESMSAKRDETATIRVTNLSEETRENDLQDLFKRFGSIQRIFLAKDKVTGNSKGFAFINFYKKEDAARAIAGVSGYGYDHLILNVEWAKPSGNTT